MDNTNETIQKNERLLDDFIHLNSEDSRGLYRSIRKYVQDNTRNHADTDDIMNDFHLKVWKNQHSYNPGQRLTPWLFVIAGNTTKDFFRSQGRHKRILSLNIGSDEELHSIDVKDESYPVGYIQTDMEINEEKEELYQAIDLLPKDNQEMLELSLKGYTGNRIANNLNIPLGTVKSRLYQVRRKLKERVLESKAA